MNMKNNYLIAFLFISSVCNAQVGIGTTNPQEELHISGVNSTIRIEKLNSVNSPLNNDGLKPAPAFVDGNGDIALGNEPGISTGKPINFLVIIDNFIVDNPYGYNEPDEENDTGLVINNPVGETIMWKEITTIPITVPQKAYIEVKYGITLYAKGEDMSAHPPPYIDVNYGQAIVMEAFFCVDLDNDGTIDSSEFSTKYGIKAQYFETLVGGISGYPYMNGQAYLQLAPGNYGLHFFGLVKDHLFSYTSVGFGGREDYLKIRIYN
jgi:hypothetical protein